MERNLALLSWPNSGTSLRLAPAIGRSLTPTGRTVGVSAQVGGSVRPSEDELLQAEWYRGGLRARRL